MAICRSHASNMIRGDILASAKIKRDRLIEPLNLIEPLKMCGISPGNYREAFDA